MIRARSFKSYIGVDGKKAFQGSFFSFELDITSFDIFLFVQALQVMLLLLTLT